VVGQIRPVLLVEDDAVLRETLRWALEDEGFQVVEAVDGLDAVDQATARRPGLVVLDMGLPGLDGYGVAAALRARYGGELPILVVTADGHASDKASRVGAYAYLHKPFDIDHLVARVHQGLG
jgi:DNA-binding response OmpR family regulator